MAFDQKKYIAQYKKDNLKQFKVDLRKEEYEEIDNFLKQHKLTKVSFVKNSFKKLKEELK